MSRLRREKRNGHGKIHFNVLGPSAQDDVMLGAAVEDRFLTLCELYLRVKGVRLPIPASLDRDFFRWRQMMVRHKHGDFRHTEAELQSVKTIAQWTVDQHNLLTGQPVQNIEWKEG
jgi:hypothetical protein